MRIKNGEQLLPAIRLDAHDIEATKGVPRRQRVAINELTLDREVVRCDGVHHRPEITDVLRDRCASHAPTTHHRLIVHDGPQGPSLLGLRFLRTMDLVGHHGLEAETVELLRMHLALRRLDILAIAVALRALLQSHGTIRRESAEAAQRLDVNHDDGVRVALCCLKNLASLGDVTFDDVGRGVRQPLFSFIFPMMLDGVRTDDQRW